MIINYLSKTQNQIIIPFRTHRINQISKEKDEVLMRSYKACYQRTVTLLLLLARTAIILSSSMVIQIELFVQIAKRGGAGFASNDLAPNILLSTMCLVAQVFYIHLTTCQQRCCSICYPR